MAPRKSLVERTRRSTAVRSAEGGAAAAVLIKVAHSLYRRWERTPAAERDRLRSLAHEVKEGALELRGRLDRAAAERELAGANEELAGAIVDSARADPEVDAAELEGLRSELARELARMAHRDAA
jgi:hypothetical protein